MTDAEIKKMIGPSPITQSIGFFIFAGLCFSPFGLAFLFDSAGWMVIGVLTGLAGAAFFMEGSVFSSRPFSPLKSTKR